MHSKMTENRQADRQAGRQTDQETDRQTDRQKHRQTDKQRRRQTDRQTDNQTHKRQYLGVQNRELLPLSVRLVHNHLHLRLQYGQSVRTFAGHARF